MRLLSVGFFIGILSVQQFSTLPTIRWELSLLLCFLALALFRKFRFFSGLIIGFLYALWFSTALLERQLKPSFESKDLILSGYVSSIPYERVNGWKFRFNVDQMISSDKGGEAARLKGSLRLSWYHTDEILQAGERWQLVVRLKRPSGFSNPGGFDYEKWLFQERVIATGYVRKSPKNTRLEQAPVFSINSIRESILRSINQHVENPAQAAIVGALAVAERDAINDQQWDILRQTGTNHLIAISGLHIGMVAGFGFLPVLVIWWLFPRLYLKIPVRLAGGVVGAVFAISYALLAGFTLPTQRALIMVLIVLFGILIRKQYASSTILATALLAVLAYDPLAVMSQGFWLSFVAVGLILYTVYRRLQRSRFDLLTVQLVLSLGMLPLTLAFFGTGSLSSPLANLLAIPWVTFIVVPLTLSAVLFIPFESISSVLFNLAAMSVDLMMQVLGYLASPKLMIQSSAIPDYLLLIVFAGFLILLLPARFPARWLGLILILPVFTYKPEAIEKGAFHYHLLDVGQGLASVVQTQNHIMIYDTGPRFNKSFDTGKIVVLPFLRTLDVERINMMMISHSDIDHRGGTGVIRDNLPVDKLITSDTTMLEGAESCHKGMKWTWDDVLFEVLSPAPGQFESDNDRSCVLRISNQSNSLLLTGDIEKAAERELMTMPEKIEADVMLIPHHGSNTSSKQPFITAVNPSLALVSTGYKNRFRFPHAKVMTRYEKLHIPVIVTSESGSISLIFNKNDKTHQVISNRNKSRKFWNKGL